MLRVAFHGRKRDGEQLASYSGHAAEFQHRIGDAATVDVDHQILDIADRMWLEERLDMTFS
jgi:hypothetical protein